LILPYGVTFTLVTGVGTDGFEKSTISNFAPMLLAMYKRSVDGSNATISAELDPDAPFE
jgi:hypothetical protein